MKITLYTISDCQFSQQEKAYLSSKNLSFEEKNLESNREFLTEMLAISNNFAGTPVTKIEKDDGQILVLKGFTTEEFDKALGFSTPPTEVQQPTQAVAPSSVAEVQPMIQPPIVTPVMPVVQPDMNIPQQPVVNMEPAPAMPVVQMPMQPPVMPVAPMPITQPDMNIPQQPVQNFSQPVIQTYSPEPPVQMPMQPPVMPVAPMPITQPDMNIPQQPVVNMEPAPAMPIVQMPMQQAPAQDQALNDILSSLQSKVTDQNAPGVN